MAGAPHVGAGGQAVVSRHDLRARRREGGLATTSEEAGFPSPTVENTIKGFDGKGYVAFHNPEKDSITWTIHVGVGDTYGLRFRYQNTTNQDMVAVISVISEEGTVLYKGTVYFSPSQHEWDKVTTTTGTSMNAGTYKIRLIIPAARGLMIDNLKVQ